MLANNIDNKIKGVTLSFSLFMFHLISFGPHFNAHISSQFGQSTFHCSCLPHFLQSTLH